MAAFNASRSVWEHLGGLHEFFVLDQLLHQLEPRIFLFALGQRRVGGQQHPRLDVDQRRRREYKLAPEVDIHMVGLLQVGEVLFGDRCDRNVVDVDLLRPDEMQQQETTRRTDQACGRYCWKARTSALTTSASSRP
jgi:hypothetical protein